MKGTVMQINRRDFLKKCGAAAATGFAFSSKKMDIHFGSKTPNILFLFSDDHACEALSAYGGRFKDISPTPNMDRIANDGIRFDRAYVTNSICCPSRAVILTGKHSHLNGQVGNGQTFNGQQQTFPKLLREIGYQTAIVGKWHLKSDPTGFDYWEVLPGQGKYYNPSFLTTAGEVQYTGYNSDIVTDLGLDWLKDKRVKDQPFMMMLQYKAPHRRFEPNLPHLTLFDDITLPEPGNLFDDYSGRGSAARNQAMEIATHMNDNDLKLNPPSNLTQEQLDAWEAAYGPKNQAFYDANLQGDDLVRWKYQRYMKDYLRCVRSVDENIGRVLDYLDESDLSDNTVVIYSSDQGFYLGEHGWFDKRFMYEESYKMPLLMRWPRTTKPGSSCDELVQNLDFAETFLNIAGAKIPSDMQGESLVPLMKGKTPGDWRKSLYYQYYGEGGHSVAVHEGVSTDRYKLIHFPGYQEWEFYDRQIDPYEMNSEYENPTYSAKINELKAELARLKDLYEAPDELILP
jgi:arylsulfatase A-like enzyme